MDNDASNRRHGAATHDTFDGVPGIEALLEGAREHHGALFDQHPVAITVLMTDFLMPYLRELYRAFDGDVVKAIVLGEIGQANMRRFVAAQHRDALPLAWVDTGMHECLLRGCNGLSVSMASGIAKETVRRKIKDLEAEGLIEHHPDGGWQATALAADRFTPTFNRDLSRRLLETALRIADIGTPMASPPRGDDANAGNN